MKISHYILLFFVLAFSENGLTAQIKAPLASVIAPSDTFPVPPENKNRLFYVQRTHNKNTIVYDINYNADSTVNESEPIKIYWIRYSDKGEIAPLSYIQNKYAYGVNAVMIDPVKKIFKVNFVSYKKRDIYLMRSGSGKGYQAFISINGKLSCLSRAFVQIDGGTFWIPHITYVEITGTDLTSGKKVKENFQP